MIIKAISIRQPWANWIAWIWKKIETRTWKTNYRGPLLIVASKKPDPNYDTPDFDTEPRGQAVAIVDLIDCRPMTWRDVGDAKCECYSGAYAWVLANVRRIKPFPVRGRQGLYDVELPEGINIAA